jgi:hypothetical protein
VTVAAQEFQDIKELEKFYADSKRVHQAALRVIHVQNASWATKFLLRKFNIDHRSEIVGMQGFSKWAQYEKPRQRNGKPYPNGRSWREQTDPVSKLMGNRVTRPRGCHVLFHPARENLFVFKTC